MNTNVAEHPRLYFDSAELERLRMRRSNGHHALIWANMAIDADRCVALAASGDWIPPDSPDPNFENLYDRFWAMMSDAAIVEHLAFAAAYGGDMQRYGAARTRLLTTCNRWAEEKRLAPDYGTAYATTRVLKAIAIGYDLLHGALEQAERAEIRAMLTACTTRLASEWFTRPDVCGPVGVEAGRHSPHHSSVEWSAFGIVGLSLLGEVPDAAWWVNATARHFAMHLVPASLSPDGSHPEGNAFWASTVLSQLQFLDPLRRVMGRDLLGAVARSTNTEIALATFRPQRERNAEGEPLYGDSTGVSALLFCLSRELSDPTLQRLAMAEQTAGRLEVWPAKTPRRAEQMRIAPGGYAYAWYLPELEPAAFPHTSPWHFPDAQEAYLRSGWEPGDALVSLRAGKVSVHIGERLIFEDLTPQRIVDLEMSLEAGTGIYTFDPPDLVCRIDDTGEQDGTLWAQCRDDSGAAVARVELDLVRRTIVIDRHDGQRRTWAYDPASGAGLQVTRGLIKNTRRSYYRPDLRPGYGLLDVEVTDTRCYKTMTVNPAGDRVTLAIGFRDAADAN